jgi:hypothetical protein
MNLDNSSRTTKKDHSSNYWKKRRLDHQLQTAQTLAKQIYGIDDLKALDPKDLKKIIKQAISTPVSKNQYK